MSRAYRLKISESVTRVIRAEDHVSTQLELLEILPAEEMAALLAEDLCALGFEQTEEGLVREQGDVRVVIDPATGTVTVHAAASQDINLSAEREGIYYDETDRATRKEIEAGARKEAQADMERQADQRTKELQRQVTDQLEAELVELQGELNGAVNRATAQALKEKAGRLGQIKELTEDPESGSLTIVLEV